MLKLHKLSNLPTLSKLSFKNIKLKLKPINHFIKLKFLKKKLFFNSEFFALFFCRLTEKIDFKKGPNFFFFQKCQKVEYIVNRVIKKKKNHYNDYQYNQLRIINKGLTIFYVQFKVRTRKFYPE